MSSCVRDYQGVDIDETWYRTRGIKKPPVFGLIVAEPRYKRITGFAGTARMSHVYTVKWKTWWVNNATHWTPRQSDGDETGVDTRKLPWLPAQGEFGYTRAGVWFCFLLMHWYKVQSYYSGCLEVFFCNLWEYHLDWIFYRIMYILHNDIPPGLICFQGKYYIIVIVSIHPPPQLHWGKCF